jgi:hypothetical protein
MRLALKSPAFCKTEHGLALFRRDELRVQGEHFDAPRDDVFYRPAGSVVASPKLKVLKIIAGFVPSASVVDGFGRKQGASEKFLHDVPMLQNLLSGFAWTSGNADHHVASLNAAGHLSSAEPFMKLGALVSRLAFGAAKFLLRVELGVPIATAVSPARHIRPALLTHKRLVCFGFLPTTNATAFAGAIERVAPMFLAICGKVGPHHREWSGAYRAPEVDRRIACGWHRPSEPVCAPASKTAIGSTALRIAFVASEWLSASFARHLDRHCSTSWSDNQGIARHLVVVK